MLINKKALVCILVLYPYLNIQGKVFGIFLCSSKKFYQENLACHRIELTKNLKKDTKPSSDFIPMQQDKTKELEMLLLKRKMAYNKINTFKGYTIQVYMGSSRTKALQAQDKVSSLLPMYNATLQYRQPNYTVQSGFFINELEANYTYLTLLKAIPNAMIRPLTISRKAYLKSLTPNMANALPTV